MGRTRQIILERHALFDSPVGKCSIAIVVVKNIGISGAKCGCAGTGDKQVKKPVVIVIAPNRGPVVSPAADTGCCRHIGEGAVAVVAIDRVSKISTPVASSGHIQVEQAIVVIVAPRNASGRVARFQTCCGCHIGECVVAILHV